MFWKKSKEIETAVEEYLDQVQACLGAFDKAMAVYFAEPLGESFAELAAETSAAEAQADDKRRDIEAAMYGRALIPESRGDVLGMLESIDLVPNQAEDAVQQIWLQGLTVPDQYVADVKKLVSVNCEANTLLCDAARMIFDDISQVVALAETVTAKEAESDDIERTLIKAVFEAPGDTADKILLKGMIEEIGAISDRAENASDRLRIIAAKRRT